MGIGEFEPEEERSDRELTLGPVMLVSLACALVLLCGLFFGFGYAAGRHGTVPASALATTSVTPMQVITSDSSAKPLATAQQPCEPEQVDLANPQAMGNVLGTPMAGMDGGAAGQQNMPRASLLMVQVAAVSHKQDAAALMEALQKRGYQAMARREPSDGLIHVQIGPFSNRDDATAMSQRLLGDGYNAIIVP